MNTDATRPSASLELGDRKIRIAGREVAPIDIAIGPRQIAETCFRHEPPTAEEIERAIDTIEDAISAAHVSRFGGASLVSGDAILHRIAVATATSGPVPRDTVEGWFNQLAAAAHGNPSALGTLPRDRESAAALLLLRELMHHLDFASIALAGRAAD